MRCGYTYTARSARIVWGGDPTEDDSEADGLAAAVSQGLSMGLTGIGYWGSDIGGFHSLFTKGRITADVFNRWVEVAAFSGIMRDQENGYPRPFLIEGDRLHLWSPEVLPIFRIYARLRTQLYPYIWAAAQDYQRSGIPIMRHLHLLWPDRPEVFGGAARHEFLFGPDLLVAPIVDEGARSRDVWLPPGQWVDFWAATSYDPASGEFATGNAPIAPIAGGRTIHVNAAIDRIPLFVRAGACIPALPADVDTLADIGTAPGLVTLADAAGRERTLDYGGC